MSTTNVSGRRVGVLLIARTADTPRSRPTAYYIGAGVIGLFVVVFGGWGIGHWWQRRKARKAAASQPIESSRVQEDTDVKDLEVQ